MQKNKARSLVEKYLSSGFVLIMLIAVVLLMTILSDRFLTLKNLVNIVNTSTMKGVIALGMTLCLICGEIDLSVGSTVALSSVLTAYVTKQLAPSMGAGAAAVVGMAVAILVAALIGTFHGLIRYYFPIPTFVITLSTQNIIYGAAALICKSMPISNVFPDWFYKIPLTGASGVSWATAIMFVLLVVLAILLRRTDLGISIYAVGGNSEAARLTGINVKRVTLFVMIAVQITAAISGIITASFVRSGYFSYGRGWETLVISSAVIGGASISGGVGSIWGTILGVMVTGVISNGMTILNLNEYIQYICNGALLFFAVLLNYIISKKKA